MEEVVEVVEQLIQEEDRYQGEEEITDFRLLDIYYYVFTTFILFTLFLLNTLLFTHFYKIASKSELILSCSLH